MLCHLYNSNQKPFRQTFHSQNLKLIFSVETVIWVHKTRWGSLACIWLWRFMWLCWWWEVKMGLGLWSERHFLQVLSHVTLFLCMEKEIEGCAGARSLWEQRWSWEWEATGQSPQTTGQSKRPQAKGPNHRPNSDSTGLSQTETAQTLPAALFH